MSKIISINEIIAEEINARPEQVEAAVRLIDEGATIPFIARYRKEITGGLDNTQLRQLDERLNYLRELDIRRQVILESISNQSKLSTELEQAIRAASNKVELEDLYLPYRSKRNSRAQVARERGLNFLADAIINNRTQDPEDLAAAFFGDDIADAQTALEGVRDILTEDMSENATLIRRLRDFMRGYVYVKAKVIEGKEKTGAKFSNYFNYEEKWVDIPSHRALAILRGRNENILSLSIIIKANDFKQKEDPIHKIIMDTYKISGGEPGNLFLERVAVWAWRVKLSLHLTLDFMRELRERADKDAIQIFARNLKDLLLAPPAGSQTILGIEPGGRTGLKVAVVDGAGKVLETAVLYPFQPKEDVAGTKKALTNFISKYKVDLIAIGNGAASRETENIVADLLEELPQPTPVKIVVSEAGASAYSTSAIAAEELPDLDVSLRGAVFIARRLQNPLAEFVKIPPRSIDVGQYQHDVDQVKLGYVFNGVVEDAINAEGADVNTASSSFLMRISGLNPGLVDAIISYRNINGPFKTLETLKAVPRMSEKSFEQSTGFLRILNGEEPLDALNVHPEAYDVIHSMVEETGLTVAELAGNKKALSKIKLKNFIDDRFDLSSLKAIIAELENPTHDAQAEFEVAALSAKNNAIINLVPGMELEGTVTKITDTGVFVNIGASEDGFVHVSELADALVENPYDYVHTGEVVQVYVLDVDLEQKHIALSMRANSLKVMENEPEDIDSEPESEAVSPAPVAVAADPEIELVDITDALETELAGMVIEPETESIDIMSDFDDAFTDIMAELANESTDTVIEPETESADIINNFGDEFIDIMTKLGSKPVETTTKVDIESIDILGELGDDFAGMMTEFANKSINIADELEAEPIEVATVLEVEPARQEAVVEINLPEVVGNFEDKPAHQEVVAEIKFPEVVDSFEVEPARQEAVVEINPPEIVGNFEDKPISKVNAPKATPVVKANKAKDRPALKALKKKLVTSLAENKAAIVKKKATTAKTTKKKKPE